MKKRASKKRKFNRKNMWKANFRKVSFQHTIVPLFRKFIEPCLKYLELPEDQTIQHHGLRLWFGVHERPIGCFKVKKGFAIPGQIQDPDTGQLVSLKYEERILKAGHQLWVRFDEDTPDHVEAEVDHTNQVFHMSLPDWNGVRGNVEYVG